MQSLYPLRRVFKPLQGAFGLKPARETTMALPDSPYTFLPMIPVDTATADQLAEIAWIEGATVAWIVRRALAGYADDYMERIRDMQNDHDAGPAAN